jgi:hypothetical protein
VGSTAVSDRLPPAFYVSPGGPLRDLLAILHPPYTAWHLSFVAIGSGLAPEIEWLRLAGTVGAFALGLGLAAHALDEWNGRPLDTGIPDRVLLALALAGFSGALLLAGFGVVLISVWVLPWAVAGIVLAAAYPLGWPRPLHTDLGFAFAWGGFPVLVGFWSQAESLDDVALLGALAATVLSLAQRRLSTSARYVRRVAPSASVEFSGEPGWTRKELLASWELPLLLLAGATILFAAAVLLRHV